MIAAPGTYDGRSGALYLDRNNGGEGTAQADDFRFTVEIKTGAKVASRGNAGGGYTPDAAIAGWDANSVANPAFDGAEWRLPLTLLSTTCSDDFRLAILHQFVTAVGDDYGWPSNASPGSPATWAPVSLSSPGCHADAAISKTDLEVPVSAGEPYTYTLTVSNAGPDTAFAVTVHDLLPDTLTFLAFDALSDTFCSEAGGEIQCAIGDIPAAGLPIQINFTVTANAIGVTTNSAELSSQTYDPVKTNNVDSESTTIGPAGSLAYIYRNDTVAAVNFKTMLEARGFTVNLITLTAAATADLSTYDALLIADDTGVLDEWPVGTSGSSPLVDTISGFHRPTIGIGEGGYAWFGKSGKSIGWPNGWHGSLAQIEAISPTSPYWQAPNDFTPLPTAPIALYTAPANHVSIYTPAAPDTVQLGLEPSAPDHAPLVVESQNCSQLWGFSGDPSAMASEGRDLFVNAVVYALTQTCTTPSAPPDCLTITTTAKPAAGSPVSIGDLIEYALEYGIADNPACAANRAELQNPIPQGTIPVPGSTDFTADLKTDGVIRWDIGTLAPGATGIRSFRVLVTNSVCSGSHAVTNQARLATDFDVALSATLAHPTVCPPGVPASSGPPWAADDIELTPYPLLAGYPTDLSIRLRNLSTTTTTLRVTFEGSPSHLGIGVPYVEIPSTRNHRPVTLPPVGAIGSAVQVGLNWVPPTSGNYGIRARIEQIPATGETAWPPIYTSLNLDVMESIKPGVNDDLTFVVGNPTSVTADIALVVDNACPGWQALVNPIVLKDVPPGVTSVATLSVIPPTDRPRGTNCSIDVQGWIADTLIGGIRKLDVPTVHFPASIPIWESGDIALYPDPPVTSKSGQVCVRLNNPTSTPRIVSVDFAWADFGAATKYTSIGSLNNITLPQASISERCIDWVPNVANNGNPHRGIQVTLRQSGLQDQRILRNVDIQPVSEPTLDSILGREIPFTIGNPSGFEQSLKTGAFLLGLDQTLVVPQIVPEPPSSLAGGATFSGKLVFNPADFMTYEGSFNADAPADVNPFVHGDLFGAEVTVNLDGKPAGGFSVHFDAPYLRAWLPTIDR
jgi:uncharacterized repeat protein (TIGR01451 family)